MSNLVKRLRSDVQTVDCDCERCMLFREAADRIVDLERQNSELLRQLAAQSEDAARYRWLLASDWYVGPEPEGIWCNENAGGLNAAIDAAMQAGKEPTK